MILQDSYSSNKGFIFNLQRLLAVKCLLIIFLIFIFRAIRADICSHNQIFGPLLPIEINETSSPESILVPKHFLNILLKECLSCYIFLVEIDEQKAYLVNFQKEPYDFNVIREFEISSGKQKGAKRSEWDLRTPKGFYEITEYRQGKNLHKKYGPGAYVLNYPNPMEKVEKRTGSGIWIHGTDRLDFIDYDSEGCIRLINEELLFLKTYLEPYQSPVIIVDKIEWVCISKLQKDKELFLRRFREWHKSWQEHRIDEYLSFYHPSFYAPNLNMDIIRWNQYKSDIFKDNRSLTVTFSNISYIFRNNRVLLQADQSYQSSNYSDAGIKTLFWELIDNKWYIILENWF